MAISSSAGRSRGSRAESHLTHFPVEDFRQFAPQPGGTRNILSAGSGMVRVRQLVVGMDAGDHLYFVLTDVGPVWRKPASCPLYVRFDCRPRSTEWVLHSERQSSFYLDLPSPSDDVDHRCGCANLDPALCHAGSALAVGNGGRIRACHSRARDLGLVSQLDALTRHHVRSPRMVGAAAGAPGCAANLITVGL